MCVPLPAWSGQTTPTFSTTLVFGLVRAHQAGEVVGVGDGHAAFAGSNGLDLVGVAALGRAREVGDDAAGPVLRPSPRPDRGNDRAIKRQVVRVGARARADLALELRIGQVFVGSATSSRP
jgi:hypothetical protein